MAREIYVDLSNSLETWRQKTNTLSGYVGDLDNLTTDDTNSVVGALNSIEDKLIDETRAKQLFSVVTSGSENYVTLSYNSANGVFTHSIRALKQSDIPELDASKITSGSFPVSVIPALPANKITSGEFDANRIPSIDASKTTTGIFDAARIPGLNASKITTGTLSADRLPDIPFEKLDLGGGTVDASSLPDTIMYINGTDLNVSGKKLFTNEIEMGSTSRLILGGTTLPSGTVDLGSPTYKFDKVYANSFEGNASTATKLASATTINGLTFDGTQAINIPTQNYTVTGAIRQPVVSFSNAFSWDFSKNYYDAFPPSGKTMSDFAFGMVSIGELHFIGIVNYDDSIVCWFEARSDRVRMWVQNTEQRSRPAINYLLFWEN